MPLHVAIPRRSLSPKALCGGWTGSFEHTEDFGPGPAAATSGASPATGTTTVRRWNAPFLGAW